MVYPAEYHVLDRQCVTRLALDSRYCDTAENTFHHVKSFENPGELIIMADNYLSCEDNHLFIECTVAEALERSSRW